MRILEMMGQMLARITKLRASGLYGEALAMVIDAQEKLFGRPASEFASVAVADQLRLLRLDESRAVAQGKCLAYASTLKEAGLVYQAQGNESMAASAFELALYVTLTIAVEPDASIDELRPQIAQLLGALPPDQIHAPIRELLDRIQF